ncbi:glycosyltransferase family 32 protein [Clostridium perfringens]|uniref:glycosyltransferase family 32 protein n=1 Tax=Clostridium perfringens TaxID=1502 RepID=UPI0018E47343|nr:glycosyltransferase [Clostridium perfringens]MBI6004189.1 mannosyltransferase [Clostridium perfringens]
MAIPKIIHYCWFGPNDKPDLVKKCMKSWGKLNGYKIVEWNEENFNFSESRYAMEAQKEKKWAFLSDYVRLKVLYEYGGIYLDTDIEVFKTLDNFLDDDMFLGFMVNCVLSAGVIGCKPKHKNIKKLIDIYDDLILEDNPNNDLFTEFFKKEYPNFLLNNKMQDLGDLKIYPKEYFNDPTFNKNINFCVHRYLGSWRKKNPSKSKKISKFAKKVLGEVVFYKINSYRLNRNSPFYKVYLEDKKK